MREPIILLILVLFLCGSLGGITISEAQNASFPLDQTEVEALRQIGLRLNVTFWNFSVDPCSATDNWLAVEDDLVKNVTCGNCNATTRVCHVTAILLESQNLTGFLPEEELANLTSIIEIDLSRNHLTGSLPKSWGSHPSLEVVGLQGNQLSGEIPEEFGNLRTLRELELENNLFNGSIPRSFGNLRNLTKLHLSANFFTGELPETLGNLENLADFRIDGNAISGKIPSFFGNLTALTRLDMQGTAMEGPFPEEFSNLTGLEELRVSDINISGEFPDWKNLNFERLFLRNCSLSGELPLFIGTMSKLKRLDLSFNNFTGEIPSSFGELEEEIDYMYLTNNMLTGAIPQWISRSSKILDISYNSFNVSPPPNCQESSVNFVASFGTNPVNSPNTCFNKNLPCSGKAMNFNLFINCGGSEANVEGTVYQGDSSEQGQSNFQQTPEKWASSSTGDFVGDNVNKYITTNISRLINTSSLLYQTARLNPLSLRYYGLCMQNGNYTVKLHFAEIVFIDGKTYLNNGRRIFDVSIQGKKVLHDFNIAQEANGTGLAIIKEFNADVNDNTLEIHFQWLGKGTNAIPERGVYGPLISAISVTPNFEPDLGESKKLSSGAIAGIVVGSCAFVLIILVLFFVLLGKKHDENKELKKELQLQTGYFTLRQIKSATQNFSPENKIGEGGFGPVFKGTLPDNSVIAVKQLSAKSKQGNREFVNEIGMISALQHPNLVKLYGCCVEGNQLLLIYEYLENNSLARALFGPEGVTLNLDWETRRKICMGIARGLAYLHEESVIKIVHRDIKATNVLLDKDLNAKISDFGLAKLDEEENTHISTRIAGTVGYMAPEYAMRGYLTDKADVYSFGIVVLEIVSGKSNTNYRPKEEFVYLLDWACVKLEQGTLLELVDPCLGSKFSKIEAENMLNIALLCTNQSPSLRPAMSAVISMLEGQTPVTDASTRLKRSPSEILRFKAFETLSHDSQTFGVSTDVPWTKSTVSSTSNREESTSLLMSESKSIDLSK